MKRGVSQKTKALTLCAILSAMGVVLLMLGALIETLDLTMAALASFFCIFVVIELGGMYPWMIFAVTGVLSVILMPYSMGGWFYLLFFGFYPILKEKLERLRRPIAYLFKLLIFNAAVFLGTVVTLLLFYGGGEGKNLLDAFVFFFGGEEAGIYLAIGTYLLANVVFVIYDLALTRIITFYFIKIRPRLNIFR